jgi:hypothetical protein
MVITLVLRLCIWLFVWRMIKSAPPPTRHAVGVVNYDVDQSLFDAIAESLLHCVVRDVEVGFGAEGFYHIRLT